MTISKCGLLSPTKLIQVCRDEADAFRPNVVRSGDKANMRAGFPSWQTSLQWLCQFWIYGPEYCSAVHWAQQNPGIAEVVSEPGPNGLADALSRPDGDPDYRASSQKMQRWPERSTLVIRLPGSSIPCRSLMDDSQPAVKSSSFRVRVTSVHLQLQVACLFIH